MWENILLLKSPIPTRTSTPTTPTPTTSQIASSGDISGTKRGSIDPLVSKRPEKILDKKLKKKNVENGQKRSKTVKNGQNVQNGPKWSKMVQNGEKTVKMVQNGLTW